MHANDIQKNIDEAIFQVKTCICSLEFNVTTSVCNEAKEIIQIIKKQGYLEQSSELTDHVNALQRLIDQAV